jgi:hypothetical protein
MSAKDQQRTRALGLTSATGLVVGTIVCIRFVTASGQPAAIGALTDAADILAGRAGTTVSAARPCRGAGPHVSSGAGEGQRSRAGQGADQGGHGRDGSG